MNGETRGSMGWIVLLGWLTSVTPLTIDMYLPGFSAIEVEFGGGRTELTLALFFVGLTFGQLVYGPLSDRYGRKPPLYVGFTIYILASLGCAVAPNMWFLGLCRLLQGLGGCAGVVIPAAIVRDRTAAREAAKTFSALMLVMGVTPIVAPIIGNGLLLSFGWRAIFVALAVYGGLALLAVVFGLSESRHGRDRPPIDVASVLVGYRRLLTNRGFLGFALTVSLSMAGMFAYIAGSPFVLMQIHGFDSTTYGWIFGFNALGIVLASRINAIALRRWPATRILHHAVIVPAVSGLALLVPTLLDVSHPGWILAAFFVNVGSTGIILPNAMSAALATHGQVAGAAAALLGALQFSFATLAGAAVGAAADGTARPLAIVMAVCGCLTWVACRSLVERHHGHRPGDGPDRLNSASRE